MVTVRYWWSPKGKPDLCKWENIVTKTERLCYHCGEKIPAGSEAILLLTERDEKFVLHESCARENCSEYI